MAVERMANPDYAGLYRRFRQGDRQAAVELFELCNGHLYRRFVLRGVDGATAADLTQDVWVRLYTTSTPERFDDDFLHSKNAVASGILKDFWKASGRNPTASAVSLEEEAGEGPALAETLPANDRSGQNPETRWLDAERDAAFQACFRQLPLEQRQVWHLVYGSDYTYQQVADLLGVKLETVHSRLRYAKETLKKCLEARFAPRPS